MNMSKSKDRAVALAGGPRALAPHVGVSRQAIEQWPHVPAKHVLTVEKVTGVSRYELRPDIYGEAPSPLARLSQTAAA